MRVGVEWARTLVEVRDDLAEREPQPSGREARQAGDLPSVPRPGPVEQPKREGCDGEQRDGELPMKSPISSATNGSSFSDPFRRWKIAQSIARAYLGLGETPVASGSS